MINETEIRKAEIDAKIARLECVFVTTNDLIKKQRTLAKIENELSKRKAIRPMPIEMIKNTYVTSDAYWRNLTRKY